MPTRLLDNNTLLLCSNTLLLRNTQIPSTRQFIMTCVLLLMMVVSSAMSLPRTEPGAVVIDEEHATEFDQLRELLGIPSGDALTAKKMTSKTARRSTIGVDCESERRKLKTAKKFDSAKFAKLCPEEAKKEEFHQGKKVMDILARPVAKKKKDLNQQKKDFIDAVYKMVRASGPVPTLQFG